MNDDNVMMTTLMDTEEILDGFVDDSSAVCSSTNNDTVNGSGGKKGSKKERQIVQMGAKDQQEVQKVRVIMILVLLITISGALVVYFYTTNAEQAQFESEFEDQAKKVLKTIGQSIERTLTALDSLSTHVTSIAQATNQTFPFVMVPDFAIHAAKSLSLTDGLTMYFNPIVSYNQRLEWELYASHNNTSVLPVYVNETLNYQEKWSNFNGPKPQNFTTQYIDVIYSDFGLIPYNTSRPDGVEVHLPQWQAFPLVTTVYSPANYDFLSQTDNSHHLVFLRNKKATFQVPYMVPTSNEPEAKVELEVWCDYFRDFLSPEENCMEPMSSLLYPVFRTLDIGIERIVRTTDSNDDNQYYPSSEYTLVGQIATEFYWRETFTDILPEGSNGMVLFINNTCGNGFTYEINGPHAVYLGVGDLHDGAYNDMTYGSDMLNLKSYFDEETKYSGVPIEDERCIYTFTVYASEKMEDQYTTKNGVIFALSAAAFIFLPFVMFLIYDWKVTRQKVKLQDTAERSDAIISSLFPSHVHDKLLAMENQSKDSMNRNNALFGQNVISPIADLYPDTTVMFADIANFTSWSSVRDPNQVFTLLESVYGVFDLRAEKRRIFKVETVGDCYVAVCGLPEPRKHHAIAMALFAKDIIMAMKSLVSRLETHLGPGTSDLSIRVGLNSGPTTAGVLRGSRGRYQLFGDTVNTAARMESNSSPGRILCSRKTADLIIAGGKEHWIAKRDDLVGVKGKGTLQCFWCIPSGGGVGISSRSASGISLSNNSDVPAKAGIDENDNSMNLVSDGKKNDAADLTDSKLVNWLIDTFEGMLVEVSRHRTMLQKYDVTKFPILDPNTASRGEFVNPRDEVMEIITLPKVHLSLSADGDVERESSINNNTNSGKQLLSTQSLDPSVRHQLRSYIQRIESMYRNNPFHNVKHAGHVIMATKKLLSRVVKPVESSASSTAYGITSDPLTQFAIVFSALIHDVDHPGVSNGQLVKEGNPIAHRYNNLNVSEQHSITIAWNLLTSSEYTDLCNVIMPTHAERNRFRQLIVNSVMATDLFDADLKSLRERRWNTAFQTGLEEQRSTSDVDQDNNRRATIVIEHLIQAADVSHTMQHWHVYQEWNRRLFHEMYLAYLTGRAEKDPSIGWYDGEIWFFDNYIIPLAKKLKTCGVFGVSCDELLDYAIDNRAEWAAKGKTIVTENIESIYAIIKMNENDGSSTTSGSNRILVGSSLSAMSSP